MTKRGSFAHKEVLSVPDDGRRREVLEGDLVVRPSAEVTPQWTVHRTVPRLPRLFSHTGGRVRTAEHDVHALAAARGSRYGARAFDTAGTLVPAENRGEGASQGRSGRKASGAQCPNTVSQAGSRFGRHATAVLGGDARGRVECGCV